MAQVFKPCRNALAFSPFRTTEEVHEQKNVPGNIAKHTYTHTHVEKKKKDEQKEKVRNNKKDKNTQKKRGGP